MRKLSNKGFTLVEVIAVVAILAILLILLIPNVNNLLNKEKNDAYDSLKQSILVAAEDYVKDNRYNDELTCEDSSSEICFNNGILSGNITVKKLLDEGYLSPTGTDSSGSEYIVDPSDRSKKLNLSASYVKVNFNSSKKDYEFSLENDYLIWQ